ncbi:MAG: hypothetical protein IJ864_05845 [Alphaproteobacteria bacterium]|nr:hypothetical protein [Alphaproteobacteria bacterium]
MFLQPNKITISLFCCCLIGIFLTFVLSSTISVDSMEHLRASYLVSIGEVPYRDFFEHHHPLLWYLWAPFMKILPHHAILVYYSAKAVALSCFGLILWIIYQILKKFLDGAVLFFPFLLVLFSFFPIWYGSSMFKPDVFAQLCYFLGLYLFFAYITHRKAYLLIWSCIAFCFSFMFLQTFIFNIVPISLVALVFFYKDKAFWWHIGLALMICGVILAICCYILYHSGALLPYMQQNWLLNSHLSLLLCERHSVLWYWILPFLAAGSVFFWLYKQENIYWKIIGFLFICELLRQCCFLAAFPHYLIVLFIYTSLLIAYLLVRLKDRLWQIYAYIFLFGSLCFNYFVLYATYNPSFLTIYAKINQSSGNLVTGAPYNIYAPRGDFYTCCALDMAMLDNYLFNRYPDVDFREIIVKEKVKYLHFVPIRKCALVGKEPERFIFSKSFLHGLSKDFHLFFKEKDFLLWERR